jgi:hypothetical protein
VTITELTSSTAGRLNLSSTDALTRIALRLNDRYRRLTSSIGLQTARRANVTVNTVVGDPRVIFAVEKLENVYCGVSGTLRVLAEHTFDEWRIANTIRPLSGTPEFYAIENTGAATVEIVLHPTPDAILALNADGMAPAATLAGSDVPAFPADFHDALVFGAMADEYAKLGNPQQSMYYEAQYEQRVADLRFFIAKSNYLQIHQGPRSGGAHRRRTEYFV